MAANDVVLAFADASPVVTLLSLDSLSLIEQFSVGYYPMALFRPSRTELLISDVIVSGGSETGRLRIWNLETLEIRATWDLPGRDGYTVYHQGMWLSEDEQILYYWHLEPCEDHLNCEELWVTGMNLDSGELGVSAVLTRNGWSAWLTPGRSASIMAMLAVTAELFALNPHGTATLIAKFDRPSLESVGGKGYTAWPIHAGLGADGNAYMVFEDGSVYLRDSRSGEQRAAGRLYDFAQTGWRLSSVQRWAIDARRVILGIGDANGHSLTEGLVGALLFNLGEPWSAHEVAIPEGTTYLALVDSDTLAIVHERGTRGQVISLANGHTVRESMPMPVNAEWIIGAHG